MNFIKKLILVLFLILCPLSAFGDKAVKNENNFDNRTSISAPKNLEKDFIKNDVQYQFINLIQNNRSTIKKTSKNNFQSASDEVILISFKENNLSSIYTNFQLSKCGKSQNLISLLLFQIQPNAP